MDKGQTKMTENKPDGIVAIEGKLKMYNYEVKPIPIGSIEIRKEEKRWRYKPEKDITTFELSKLLVLFTHFNVGYEYDFWGYVKNNKLERHFYLKEQETE